MVKKTKFEVVQCTKFESSPIMVPPSWNRKSNLAYESSDLRSGGILDFGIQNCRGDFEMKFVAPAGPGGAEVIFGFFRDFCNPEQFLKITWTCIPNCLSRKSGCFLHDKKSWQKSTSWCYNVWPLYQMQNCAFFYSWLMYQPIGVDVGVTGYELEIPLFLLDFMKSIPISS